MLRVDVEGGGSPAPDSAVAVAVNLTGVLPDVTGFVRAFPCDVGEPDISSINPRVGTARANSAIIPTAADGTICLTSNVTTNVLIDITGWFGPFDGRQFVPLTPIRLTDTRQSHPDLNGGSGARLVQPGETFRVQVAGNRGVPADSKAATLNLVAVGWRSCGLPHGDAVWHRHRCVEPRTTPDSAPWPTEPASSSTGVEQCASRPAPRPI